MLERRLLKRVDWLLLGSALGLQLFGLIAVASATGVTVGDSASFGMVRRQFVAMMVGWVGLYLATGFDYGELKRFTRPIYIFNVLLLGATLYLGERAHEAQRWLYIGPLGFQPAEIVKVGLIATLACHVSRFEGVMTSWRQLIWSLVHIAAPLALIMLQPDLGTGLVLVAIWLGVVLIGGVPPVRLTLIVCVSLALVGGALAMHLHADLPLPLQPYQINRLVVFVNPGLDPTGLGYQLRQSIMAVGSGRLTGQGLFSGDLTRLRYLPYQHTDFIFAVIAEELGLRGVTLLLALFAIFFWRSILVILGAKDVFGALLATGVVSMLAFHVIVNVGMAIGLMPITGLPLPFISVGGSSLLANSIAVGLLVNVGIRKHRIMF